MGIVIRQGLKTTFLQYAGLSIGLLAYVFLYVQYRELYGFVQILIAAAGLVMPFAMLGSYSLAVRFYPLVSDDQAAEQHGFLTFLLGLATAGLGLYLLASPYLQVWVVNRFFADVEPAYKPYFGYLPGLVVLLTYLRLLYQYATNFRLLTVPLFFEQTLLKLALPTLFLGVSLGMLDTLGVVRGVLLNYGVAVLGLSGYLLYQGRFVLKPIKRQVSQHFREMASFSGFGIASMLGSQLAFRIDTIMVGGLIGLEEAGIYNLILFMSEVIAKPYASLKQVVAPQVAEAWAKQRPEDIGPVYKSSSINLLLICGLAFGTIVVCFHSLTELTVQGEALWIGFTALLLLGSSRLVDAATSINEHILLYSPKYRINLLMLLTMAALNVLFNILLVPRLGITGAALSTLISLTVFNLAKVLYVGFTYGLWPFTQSIVVVVATFSLLGLAVFHLPSLGSWYIDLAIRAGLYGLGCLAVVLLFRPSEEAHRLLMILYEKVRPSKA